MTLRLFDVLQRVADELPGCELTSVASLESGLSLASAAPGAERDVSAADAFGAQLYRLLADALDESGASGDVEDFVIQGRQRTCVAVRLEDSGYFWHVSTTADTMLGFTQAVIRKYQSQVTQGVRELLG